MSTSFCLLKTCSEILSFHLLFMIKLPVSSVASTLYLTFYEVFLEPLQTLLKLNVFIRGFEDEGSGIVEKSG